MVKQQKSYLVGDADLSLVRNRNELRVIECMRATLEELGNPELPEKLLKDAYAYTLNQLPARYAQGGTIVLRDPVRKETIEAHVSKALRRVLENPKLL